MDLLVQRSASARRSLSERFSRVRAASIAMCESLEPAEYRLQPIDDVSPPWWNLGHTSWFFARNVLAEFAGEVTDEDRQYDYLLNSYYASLGRRLPRSQRGSVSRPSTEDIYAYRASVDRRMHAFLEQASDDRFATALPVVEIGLQHEQQHQELFFTEIKFILAQNPPELRRTYQPKGLRPASDEVASHAPLRFIESGGGLIGIGHAENSSADNSWCWDNELPRHHYFLAPYALADRLATNREYLDFISDGGYRNQLLWLDNGWKQCRENNWNSPLYWERLDGHWSQWTLHGQQSLPLDEPVSHLSFYEADAFARWSSETTADQHNVRLPTEREWEHAARSKSPAPQLLNVLWQWTSSYYEPYPGYKPFPGVLAEYNGKFMDNQRVLRGGSCYTPPGHARITYRNFWSPATRFQFTGLRLARDC